MHIKECCTCKVVVKTCAFLRPQRGFSNRVLRKKLTFTSFEPELRVSTPYEFLVSVHTLPALPTERATVLSRHTRALSVHTTFNTLQYFVSQIEKLIFALHGFQIFEKFSMRKHKWLKRKKGALV